MQKFIKESLILIILSIISAYFLYNIRTPSPIAERIFNIDEKLDLINLGTSHANCFNYNDFMLNGKRINREGNTLYYDLQNYIYLNNNNYLTTNAIVIIPVSYFVFGLDENRTDRMPDDSFVNDFYYYLPEKQIFSFSEKKRSNLFLYTIQKNFRNLIIPEKPKIEKNFSDLNLHANIRVNKHKKLSDFSSKQKNLDYIENLINLILENKHLPILVTTPYHNSYNNYFGKEWLNNNYFNFMQNLSLKHNLNYLDYSDDARFCFEDNYFSNSDHLNVEGSKEFSSVFFSDLNEILFTLKRNKLLIKHN